MALLTQREYMDTTTLLKVLLIIIFVIHLYLHYSWYWQGMVWTLSGVCLLWSTVKMVILKKNVVSPCYWYSSNLSYDWSIQEWLTYSKFSEAQKFNLCFSIICYNKLTNEQRLKNWQVLLLVSVIWHHFEWLKIIFQTCQTHGRAIKHILLPGNLVFSFCIIIYTFTPYSLQCTSWFIACMLHNLNPLTPRRDQNVTFS